MPRTATSSGDAADNGGLLVTDGKLFFGNNNDAFYAVDIETGLQVSNTPAGDAKPTLHAHMAQTKATHEGAGHTSSQGSMAACISSVTVTHSQASGTLDGKGPAQGPIPSTTHSCGLSLASCQR